MLQLTRRYCFYDPNTGLERSYFTTCNEVHTNTEKYHAVHLSGFSRDFKIGVLGRDFWCPSRCYINRVIPRYAFHFVFKGKGKYNGHSISAGDMFINVPWKAHSVASDPDDPLCFVWVMTNAWFIPVIESKIMKYISETYIYHFPKIMLDEICKYYERMLVTEVDIDHKTVEAYADIILSMVMWQVNPNISQLTPPADKTKKISNEIVQNTIYYIDNNYSDSLLKIEQLAKISYVSTSHLCRLFKKHVGISPQEYVTNRRMERAAELLRLSPNIKMKNLANSIGYSSYIQFEKNFRRFYGCSPSEFKLKNDYDN